MAGNSLELMPMSPRQSPAELGHAVLQWAKSKRGRIVLMAGTLMLIFVGLASRNTEAISYKSISGYHLPSWRPHLPTLPSFTSPLKPSNTTLELENGEIDSVPSQLHKATPNFHLLMPALTDNYDFCRTTLSAMLLNYPPPTIINIFQEFYNQEEREETRLRSIKDYLHNDKLVKDEDLVLLVDGYDTWFQLPSEVMIRQYQSVLADANKRLLEKYGFNKEKNEQTFSQSIVFGAEKACEAEDLACRYAPESMLPVNIYGKDTNRELALSPARFLNAGTVIGPAKDLRAVYDAAVTHWEEGAASFPTGQSVLATIFGEQQLAREAERKTPKNTGSKWLNWLDVQLGRTVADGSENLRKDRNYEFGIGLDYTHTLFQPLPNTAEDELVPLPHDNSTDLRPYHHSNTPTPPLSLPLAVEKATLPFSRIDPDHKAAPSDNKPSFIEPLQFDEKLDELMPANTSWANVSLITNTYTGAIPVLLHRNLDQPISYVGKPRTRRRNEKITPEHLENLLNNEPRRYPDPNEALKHTSANLTWQDMWFSGYERALLRKYFRTPQSPIGYHAAAVGGDRVWDQRGGRGGVWTERQEIWLPYGEVDGVCGTVDQITQVFADGKGIWLHEKQDNAEALRRIQETELKGQMEEMKKWEEQQRKKEEEERRKNEETRAQEKREAREAMEFEAERRVQVDAELPADVLPPGVTPEEVVTAYQGGEGPSIGEEEFLLQNGESEEGEGPPPVPQEQIQEVDTRQFTGEESLDERPA